MNTTWWSQETRSSFVVEAGAEASWSEGCLQGGGPSPAHAGLISHQTLGICPCAFESEGLGSTPTKTRSFRRMEGCPKFAILG